MLYLIGIFILTITRIKNNESTSKTYSTSSNKVPKASRKKHILSASAIYRFNCFDDFLNYVYVIRDLLDSSKSGPKKIAKNTSFYFYKGNYYLIFIDINSDCSNFKKIFSTITEFATFVSCSDLFGSKIYESGKPIFSNNALINCISLYKK